MKNMKNKWRISTIEFMSISELLALPILLFLYDRNPFGFWTLLLYLDVMQLYLVDMRQIMQAIKAERYADLWKRYKVYAYGTSLCYLVLAFKDSGLCMILVGNDLLMTLLNPFVKKKYQGK